MPNSNSSYQNQKMEVRFRTDSDMDLIIHVDGEQVYPIPTTKVVIAEPDYSNCFRYDVRSLGDIATDVGYAIDSEAVASSLYVFLKGEFPTLDLKEGINPSALSVRYPDSDLVRTAIELFFHPDIDISFKEKG